MTENTDASREDRLRLFRQLYDAFQARLFTYIGGILGNRHDAEEAMQTLFLKLYRSPQGLQRALDNPSYLFGAARNACYSLREKRRQQGRSAEQFDMRLIEARSTESDPEEAARLNAALRTLPDEQREVVVMRVFSDLSFEAIAEVTRAPLSTVYKRYHAAIQKLQERWIREL